MSRLSTILLRIILVVVLLGTLLVQVLLVFQANATGQQYPEVEYLVVPYAAASVGAVALMQIALCAVWRLLSMVAGAGVFTAPALKWVNVVITCAAAISALSLLVFVHWIVIAQIGGPGMFLLLGACVVLGSALTLFLIVMRDLLRTAINDRSELAQVI